MIERYRRPFELLLFGVLPVVVAVAMFATAHSTDSLSADFHNELYPEAKKLLDWESPFPPPGSAIWYGHNMIWPPVAAFLIAPLTILSPGAADWAIALVGLACFMGRCAIVGVRDWRVYGVFALWPQVIGEIRVSHLTPVPLPAPRARRGATATRASRPGSRSASRARSSSSSGRSGSGSPRSAASARRSSPRRSQPRRSSSCCPFTSLARLLPRARRARDGRSTRTATRPSDS